MAETITAVAALLWPLLVVVVLVVFARPLVAVVRSATQRDWTIEVGGQRLSMGQLNDQQNRLISDLQTQISALHQRLADLDTLEIQTSDPDIVWSPRAAWKVDVDKVPHSVLWVDDVPANNALIVEQLQQNGVRVDLVASTAEGMSKLGRRRYGAVLSDMSRRENGSLISDAGLRLLEEVREKDPGIPFLIYCSPGGVSTYREAATSAGADVITASPGVLSDRLHSLGLL